MPGYAPPVVAHANSLLRAQGIAVHRAQAVGVADGLLLPEGRTLSADAIIAATGSRAPCWLQLSRLALDEQGFVRVDASHRSVSHRNVFAAGDICARDDGRGTHSGVHAVRAGPVLARNLMASTAGGKLATYEPRKWTLYILATGSRHAILSWGGFGLTGHWVWRLKDWIDRRFIRHHSGRYLELARRAHSGTTKA